MVIGKNSIEEFSLPTLTVTEPPKLDKEKENTSIKQKALDRIQEEIDRKVEEERIEKLLERERRIKEEMDKIREEMRLEEELEERENESSLIV